MGNSSMTWEERDLRHIWHPCSQMKDYEELPPIVVDRGKGAWLYDIHGRRYLDIVSSWWANLLGHAHPRINAAIKEQIDRLEHVIFANFSHEPAILLAEELAKILPPGLTRFHFNDNGSAAVECALKLCFQFYHQTGKPKKTRFLCLSEGYHGETIGALSVGSMDLYAKLYRPMLMDCIHAEAPDCYRCAYGKMRETCDCPCIEHAEAAFAAHGWESAAMIVEPLLQGSAGMRVYPALYLKKLRELCDRHDVKLIADEIATGFGRTGTLFACEQAGISPDVMCLSKGLTGGYLPMSVTCVTEEIYQAFYGDYGEGKAFLHSHTYAGNPLGCAAARAVQRVLREEHILEQAAATARWLTAEMETAFGHHPNVGEIRHIGLIHAMELVQDRDTKKPLDGKKRTGYEIYRRALKKGLLLRPLGDVLYFNPPLTITRGELSEAIRMTKEAMEEVLPSGKDMFPSAALTEISRLTGEILSGRRIGREDDLSRLLALFLETPLAELSKEAWYLQTHFKGKQIDFCTILNGRSGRCSEDCRYCAQSAHHTTGIEEYGFLPREEILANARANEKAGVNRFAIVTSGRALQGKAFDEAIAVYEEMSRTLSLHLCASHGILELEQLQRLRAAGVTRYHHNLETSRRYFPHICTTHTYDDRIRTIRLAQEAGLTVCSGGIIGMGETWEDRMDLAVSLAELGIESIPINVLVAIPGTELEDRPPLSPEEILRTIAMFRFINPAADIRLAAGRKLLPQKGKEAFLGGASAAITGNMLTTSGISIREDLEPDFISVAHRLDS